MLCIDRLPAIPLVASDPYLSIWMPADTMTQTDTCHWSGPAKPIRGVLTVDGAACRFLGKGAEPEAALTELKVTATRTRFVSEFGGVQLETTFATRRPCPHDLDLLSMPLTLVTHVSAKAHRTARHTTCRSSCTCPTSFAMTVMSAPEYDRRRVIRSRRHKADRLHAARTTQKPLSHSADHIDDRLGLPVPERRRR